MSDGGNQPSDIETFSIPSKINNHESSIVKPAVAEVSELEEVD
jgi:hypothetical protein